MDLAGAFVDAERANIPVEALDASFLDVALSIEDARPRGRRRSAQLSVEKYLQRNIHRDVFAAIALASSFKDEGPRRFDLSLAIGEHGWIAEIRR